jgi:hypothetical protein
VLNKFNTVHQATFFEKRECGKIEKEAADDREQDEL